MNRHLKTAFFIAPLLAIAGYIGAGYFISSKQADETYGQLQLAGSCLPTENACVFISPAVELKLISNEQQGQQQLALITTQPVKHLTLGMAEAFTDNKQPFRQFQMMKSDDNKYWQIKLQPNDIIAKYKHIRIAFSYQGKGYFAESEVRF
ncbi:hypothetical protein OS175_13630 [Marinicella sp. S1101]|uniref:hypothetical protein n=1 Tax=Marinicella marina TaxID=2996016 RepID=UPI002260E6ED|nr:hypothetical protein [Marinicella marina]MCX7554915.1 hypothetical protein [Marinicella marina]MDJ1141261.1 hypothetical protein [Marinicella marina]